MIIYDNDTMIIYDCIAHRIVISHDVCENFTIDGH